MTTEILVVGVLVLMLVLLLLRVPVAVSLGLSGAVGLALLQGLNLTTNVLGAQPFTMTAAYSMTIVPMFILMGMFAVKAHVADYVFRIANRVLGRFPGGLGVATIAASAGFSAVSGSSIGTAATMARLSVNEMRRAGYPLSLATALVAVAGTLGSMIPPSTFLVLYAILAQVSIAQMLAAGVVPGLLSALTYAIYLMVAGARLQRRGVITAGTVSEAVAQAQSALAEKREMKRRVSVASGSWPQDLRSQRSGAEHNASQGGLPASEVSLGKEPAWSELPWRGLAYIAVLFLIVLGGMYSGAFTATESAAFGALAGILILLIEKRKSGAKAIWASVRAALEDTASTTSMVFFIVIGSGILTVFFVSARVPQMITDAVLGWNMPPLLVMSILLLALIPLGMVLESLSILIISVPLILPLASEYGYDAIWLGILIVKFIEIGMVTPPVGINAFVVAGSTGIRAETVFRGIMPFFLLDMALITVFFFSPDLILFLPSLVAAGSG